MERKDLEELDLDAAAASPSSARSLLVLFRSILLQLMALVADLRATLDEHNRLLAEQNERKCSPWPVRAQRVQRRGSPVAGSGRSDGIDGRLAGLVVFGEDVNAHRRVPEEGARVHAAQLGGLDECVEDRRDFCTAT